VNDRTQLKFSDTVKDGSDPRLEELIRIYTSLGFGIFLEYSIKDDGRGIDKSKKMIGTE